MEAKRGDLVVIETTDRTYVIGQPTESRTSVEIGVVTSITRDGIVKKVKVPTSAEGTHEWVAERMAWKAPKLSIVPKSLVSVPDVLAAYAAHTWGGHTSTKPLESLDEARALVRAHAL